MIDMHMLNKVNVGSINPEKGWPVPWKAGCWDKNGNDGLTSFSNVASLEREAVFNEVLNGLVKYKSNKPYLNANNVQEHPEVWRLWSKLLKKC